MGCDARPEPPPEGPRPVLTPPAPVPPKMTCRPKKPRPQPRPAEGSSGNRRQTREHRTAADRRQRTRRDRRSGQGFGLSSAGGAGGPVQVDCLNLLSRLPGADSDVHPANWDKNQGVGLDDGEVHDARDGTIQASWSRAEWVPRARLPAMRAVQDTRLPPLPRHFRIRR